MPHIQGVVDVEGARRSVITVGREYGSGGRLIAKRVAEMLGIPFYDKELLELAAEKTGFSEEFIKKADEHRASGFMYSMFSPSQNLPLHDQVFIAQSNIIKKIASQGPCVIVGRCSDYVLKKHESALHVFVHAPMQQRIERARKSYGKEGDDKAIEALITKTDKNRASYYNNFTMGKWGASTNYDMTISSALGIDVASSAIIAAASLMQQV